MKERYFVEAQERRLPGILSQIRSWSYLKQVTNEMGTPTKGRILWGRGEAVGG